MRGISLKVPEPLAARLSAVAEWKGTSKSAVIREAVEKYIVREEGARPRSALSLVADLAGSCEGPADLSVGRKRFEGHGE